MPAVTSRIRAAGEQARPEAPWSPSGRVAGEGAGPGSPAPDTSDLSTEHILAGSARFPIARYGENSMAGIPDATSERIRVRLPHLQDINEWLPSVPGTRAPR